MPQNFAQFFYDFPEEKLLILEMGSEYSWGLDRKCCENKTDKFRDIFVTNNIVVFPKYFFLSRDIPSWRKSTRAFLVLTLRVFGFGSGIRCFFDPSFEPDEHLR
jgi:hypothetical protein